MMSPAPIAAEMQQDQRLETLARAFEALLMTTQQLNCKEKSLQQRLEYASDEVTTPSTSFSFSRYVCALPPPCVSKDEKKRLALDQESLLRR